MALAVSVLCVAIVAFQAFAIWLAVRISKRQERWAKWTARATFLLVLAFLLLTGYALSYGPACWFVFHGSKEALGFVLAFYAPLEWAAGLTDATRELLAWWFHLWTGIE